MTPKEKADELFRKMYETHSVSPSDITKYFAKQCSLIAVDEILNIEHPQVIIFTEISKNSIRDYFQDEYWDEVKKEIEKL